jgi:hypothetical protein
VSGDQCAQQSPSGEEDRGNECRAHHDEHDVLETAPRAQSVPIPASSL